MINTFSRKTLMRTAFAVLMLAVITETGLAQTAADKTVVISQKKMYAIRSVLFGEAAEANDAGRKLLDLVNRLPDDSDIKAAAGKDQVIGSVRITVSAGIGGIIYIGKDASYFEKAEDGTFVLKKTTNDISYDLQGIKLNNPVAELSPGVRVFMIVNDTEKKDYVKVEYMFSVTGIKGRAKIPGVGKELDVGKPILVSFQTNGAMTLELGKWSVIDKQVECSVSGKLVKVSMLVKISPI